jgi:hypothetical protein
LPGDHEAEFLLFGFGSSLLVQCIGSAKFVTLYVVLATIQIVGQMLEPAEEEGGAEEGNLFVHGPKNPDSSA